PFIQTKLYHRENDRVIQKYTKSFIKTLDNVDMIVISDMTGEKYSHLDENQVGKIFVNEDKNKVLATGESYYSVMEGSMGKTLRWFQPIMHEGNQVGFVMVAKYYKDINIINKKTKLEYLMLFVISFSIAVIASKLFAKNIRKAMLGMEPYEIATLYNQKKIIINTVKEGIIALDKDDKIIEINKNCYKLFKDFNIEKVLHRLDNYIKERKAFEMKELIIQGQKIFVTLQPIIKCNKYLGVVINFIDKKDINKIAKEITGVDEVVKDLRANVHEFKNNLHVILGLIQLEEYKEAEKYILKIQQVQRDTCNKFSNIEDYYVRALMLSRELVAKERKVSLVLTEESFLYGKHEYVSSYDIVTILGNLIENAFEACVINNMHNKIVEVTLGEDDKIIEIQVRDNGVAIDKSIKDEIFNLGVSSKGEGRGTGLNLVKNRVELYEGSINIEEFEGEKIFTVILFKGEKNK
ncbi:MAG: ATP-binding protein, partial [Sarcina sp.]